MLTPRALAGLPEPILALWSEAERLILQDMARRISKYDFWIPAVDHQHEKLLEAGRMQAQILAELSKLTRRTEQQLREMMADAGSRCLRADIEVYEGAGMSVPKLNESAALKQILNAGYQATAQTMKNLTRTTAQTATRQFENALDRAWLQVSSGAFDYDTAIRGAIKELAANGIGAITYPSGKTDSIETAVRRAVLTGVNQTAGKLQLELAQEVGCDLVEVSAHAGARPEHALWQGRIYSLSGKSKKYPDFVSSTGYGTGAGLCGWNCRHSFGPYVEGSSRVWTDEKLAELDAPKYEYNGEKLTEYEATQQQRYHERQIRRWKREQAALDAAGQDSSKAAAKVKLWQDRQKDFINQTGLKRDYEREQIVVADSQKRSIIAMKNEARAIDSILMVDDTDKHKYTPVAIMEELQKSPVGVKTIRNIRDSNVVIEIVDEPQYHDNRGEQEGNIIRIFSANIKSPRVAGQTVIHEITHYAYQVGRCQHAEAICFAMEKMHILGRDYLTSEEWKQMVDLAKQAYPEYEWEEGGYGDFSQFNFVVE